MNEREMYLYECTDCCVVFGVEAAYEDHSIIVCPVCQTGYTIEYRGCGVVTITRGPEV